MKDGGTGFKHVSPQSTFQSGLMVPHQVLLSFNSSKGLRQGDPLPPLLFILWPNYIITPWDLGQLQTDPLGY